MLIVKNVKINVLLVLYQLLNVLVVKETIDKIILLNVVV